MVKQDSKKILLLTIGNVDHPSSRIRGIQYIPLLEKEGYEVEWIPRIPVKGKGNKIYQALKKRLFKIMQLYKIFFGNYDILFIQKIFIPEFILKKCKNRGKKFIFDFDDSIFLNQKNLLDEDLKNKSRTLIMLQYSDKTIVSTPYLANWCKKNNYNTITITTPVDLPNPLSKTTDENLKIGWIGSSTNTVHLYEIEQALVKLAKEIHFTLYLVGANQDFNIEGIHIKNNKWTLESEKEHLDKMDIGIMPLLKNNYSKGKGGYKLFVYMAHQIPVVAENIGINKEIVDHGVTGYIASNEDEWYMYLKDLLIDNTKRIEFGEKGFDKAKKLYSREITFNQLLKALNF
jgi:glycosyltransferase involved in cell wall biosynthesis